MYFYWLVGNIIEKYYWSNLILCYGKLTTRLDSLFHKFPLFLWTRILSGDGGGLWCVSSRVPLSKASTPIFWRTTKIYGKCDPNRNAVKINTRLEHGRRLLLYREQLSNGHLHETCCTSSRLHSKYIRWPVIPESLRNVCSCPKKKGRFVAELSSHLEKRWDMLSDDFTLLGLVDLIGSALKN